MITTKKISIIICLSPLKIWNKVWKLQKMIQNCSTLWAYLSTPLPSTFLVNIGSSMSALKFSKNVLNTTRMKRMNQTFIITLAWPTANKKSSKKQFILSQNVLNWYLPTLDTSTKEPKLIR